MRAIIIAAIAILATACAREDAQPQHAADAPALSIFHAALDGAHFPTQTGSAATGEATITVDHAAQTVDLALTVHGMTLDSLWDMLVTSPVGPLHLHLYDASGDAVVLMPFPYSEEFAASADGFTVTVTDAPYAERAALAQSALSFDEFVAGLGSGQAYLNLHTDAFHDGEISGLVTAE
ncbi:MAG: CHRD domain-containing protein [Parvularculaceae bacterium]